MQCGVGAAVMIMTVVAGMGVRAKHFLPLPPPDALTPSRRTCTRRSPAPTDARSPASSCTQRLCANVSNRILTPSAALRGRSLLCYSKNALSSASRYFLAALTRNVTPKPGRSHTST